jgi:hypothetical protein
MRFNNPISFHENYISDKIKFVNQNDYYKIIATSHINKEDIIIIEYSIINLFGEVTDNRELKIVKKYIENKNTLVIKNLYPRTENYKKTNMIKSIHNLIKNVKHTDIKLYMFFQSISKKIIEFYFAKYLYNAFEGNEYGPLTLQNIAKINHSCNPNVYFIFNKTNGCMYLKAKRNINKNEEILDSYLENKKINNHKLYLEMHYGFNCDCAH